MKIGISNIHYISYVDFDENEFYDQDKRIMDVFTMISIKSGNQLLDKINYPKDGSNNIGVVLATKTGPVESIQQFINSSLTKGYVGINPSKFPNIMNSSALCRISKSIKAYGPSTTIFIDENSYQPIKYSIVQLLKNRCIGMLVIYNNESKGCFSLFIENDIEARRRGIPLRFNISNIHSQ